MPNFMNAPCHASSPRRRGAAFTFEVQHLSKGLGWGSEVKAFARGVVVGGDAFAEAAVWEGSEIGFARDEAAHPADGIFDAALLPGCVGIAEEGLDRELMQCEVAGELGSVIEGDGMAQRLGHSSEQPEEMAGDTFGGLAGEADGEQQARGALMYGQDCLAVFCEHHQISFPVAGGVAIGGLERSVCYGN